MDFRFQAWIGLLLTLVAGASWALPLQAGAPIDVEAYTFVIDLDTQRAYWAGNVVARQNGHVIRAAELTIRMAETTSASSDQTSTADQDSSAHHPSAVVVEAGSLGYRQSYGELVSSGGTVITRGDSRIESHTLIYATDLRQARGQSDDDGRVRVRLTLGEDDPIQFETAAMMGGGH